MKMRELIRITFVCVCAFLLAVREGRGEDVPKGLEGSLEQDVRKDSKTSPLSGTTYFNLLDKRLQASGLVVNVFYLKVFILTER